MRPRILIVLAVLATASPAVAAFDGHAGSAQNAARAAAVFRPVAGKPAPEVTSAPRYGATLSSTTGTWLRDPASFERRWLRCDAQGAACVPSWGLPTISVHEIGRRLRVQVTARNGGGSATAMSPPSAGIPPEPQATGRVFGTPRVGSPLSFSSGGWRTNPALPATTERRWWRCPTGAWSPERCVQRATGEWSYTPVEGDIGSYLLVVETAETAGFSARDVSGTSSTVAPPESTFLPRTGFGQTGPALPSWEIERLADFDYDSAFRTDSATAPVRPGEWIAVDFGAVKTLTQYLLDHNIRSFFGAPAFTWVTEISTDATSWTVLPHASMSDLPAGVRARYLRVRATNDPGAGWWVISLGGFGY